MKRYCIEQIILFQNDQRSKACNEDCKYKRCRTVKFVGVCYHGGLVIVLRLLFEGNVSLSKLVIQVCQCFGLFGYFYKLSLELFVFVFFVARGHDSSG